MATSPNAKQLVEFLVDEFTAAMEQQNATRPGAFDIPDMLQQLASFRQFAKEYLEMHRPQQLLTNLDGNYGVQLTNLKTFIVAPPMEAIKGTMQPSQHVGVTGAETASDMQAAGAVPLTQNPNLIPPGAVDFTRPGEARDMTASRPAVRFDQEDPRKAGF